MQKKIVFLISSLAGGGSERICVTLANSFVKKGWKVDLIVLNLDNETYLHLLSSKVNLIILKKKHIRYSCFALLKYVFKNKPTVFLVFNYELAVILILLRTFLRLKIKIISRNNNVLSIKLTNYKKGDFWSRWIVSPLIKKFYYKVDHIINQCYAMKDDLIILNSNLSNKLSVIYNPIDSKIEEYINNHDLSKIKRKNYILYVGRLEEQKGVHFVIDAFSSISHKFPDISLKIIGQGSLYLDLKKKVIDYNLQNKVDFEGFQKNLIPYYLHAKLTVLSSIYEGYPNVLIESIALNTPVVSFDCPNGPSEIIKNGINGFLVKHQNVSDLKEKISILLSNGIKYKQLKYTVLENKTEYVVDKYEKIIISLE